MFPIDSSLTYARSTTASQFTFNTSQSNLVGGELVYDVSIGSLTKNVVSSTSTFTVYLEATSRHLQTCTKAGSWVTPATLALTYDIRNPPASTTLTSVAYIGPDVATCG